MKRAIRIPLVTGCQRQIAEPVQPSRMYVLPAGAEHSLPIIRKIRVLRHYVLDGVHACIHLLPRFGVFESFKHRAADAASVKIPFLKSVCELTVCREGVAVRQTMQVHFERLQAITILQPVSQLREPLPVRTCLESADIPPNDVALDKIQRLVQRLAVQRFLFITVEESHHQDRWGGCLLPQACETFGYATVFPGSHGERCVMAREPGHPVQKILQLIRVSLAIVECAAERRVNVVCTTLFLRFRTPRHKIAQEVV